MLNLNLDVDDVWKALGSWGRYQKFQILILFFDGMATAFHLLSAVVIGYRYPYKCQEMELNCTMVEDQCYNSSIYIEYGKCDVNIYRNDTNLTLIHNRKCENGYTYPVHKDATFVTEWDLVCKNAEFAEFTQTLVIIGQATGAAIFTQFSDRFGRKPVHVLAHIGIFAIALAMAFAPNFLTFAILRYLVGTFQQGIVMTNTVMVLEMLPREYRYIGHTFGAFAWTTGVVLLAPIGYLFRNTSWRYMQLTLALYSSYSLILYWVLEESVRWVVANGKSKEAERIIRKAARWNKVSYEEVIEKARFRGDNLPDDGKPPVDLENKLGDIYLDTTMPTRSLVSITIQAIEEEPKPDENEEKQDEKEEKQNNKEDKQNNDKEEKQNSDKEEKQNSSESVKENDLGVEVKRYTFFTILRNRKILINSIILWYIWIVDSLVYYGIALFSYSLSGNRFLNFFLTAIMDYPAALTEMYLMNRIGRKKTVIFFHAVTGLSCLLATVFVSIANGNSAMLSASTAFTLIGKYGSAGSFGSVFLYTPELYPTNLRNVGLGVSSTISRVGGMLAPFAGPLAMRIRWAPGAIFGTMCMLVTLLCLRLPETREYELPQTLEEMDKWKTDNKSELKSES